MLGAGGTVGPVEEDRTDDRMDLERADAYGRSFGDVYDTWYDGVTDAEATADFVAARHRDRRLPALELGVGTGRLAGPLAARGLTVVGLDASAAMVRRCPREGVLPVLADMAALPFRPAPERTGGTVGSVLVAFNTLFNLTTAEAQAGLLAELARLVDPRGVVVVEMLDVSPLLDGPDRSIGLREARTDPLVVTATRLDRQGQRLWGRHVELSDRGVTLRPWLLRWTTPDELDAMALGRGLVPTERVGSWSGAPVGPDTATVISVYRPAR